MTVVYILQHLTRIIFVSSIGAFIWYKYIAKQKSSPSGLFNEPTELDAIQNVIEQIKAEQEIVAQAIKFKENCEDQYAKLEELIEERTEVIKELEDELKYLQAQHTTDKK